MSAYVFGNLSIVSSNRGLSDTDSAGVSVGVGEKKREELF